MSDSGWQQVEDIFHRAKEVEAEQRAAFLDEACGPDLRLRREVESLLAHEKDGGGTFAGPAAIPTTQTMSPGNSLRATGSGPMKSLV